MVDLVSRLAKLSPRQRGVLERRLLDSDGEFGIYPLSPAQQRIWFLEQLGVAGPTFRLPVALLVDGVLDLHTVERTVRAIMRRHDVLRATFFALNGPLQRISAPEELAMLRVPVLDLSGRDVGEEPDDALCRALRDELRVPFDLASGPPIRTCLFRLGPARSVLMFTVHHIVFDEASRQILLTEFAEMYCAFAQGRDDPLPPLLLQYPDFAVWGRRRLTGERVERDLDYWRRQLSGPLPVLKLPTDRPRPPVLGHEGATVEFRLPAALRDRLIALGQSENATLFMVLLAVYGVLLCRCAGQQEVVVGTPIAGRSRPELRQLIGVLLNVLALRLDTSGDPSFRRLLARVRRTAVEAYAHEGLPFEKLIEKLNPPRDTSRTPLFQTVLQLTNGTPVPLNLPDAMLTPMRVSTGTAQNDLTMIVHDEPDGLRAEFRYNVDLFERRTVCRLSEHVRSLLWSVVDDPERPISRLPLLDEE